MIQCEGQIEMTDYLRSKIKSGMVKDLTAWINSQGKAQYTQIEEVVRETYEKENDSPDLVDKDIDIIAWKPLPKPFQNGDNNENS